MYKFFGIDKPNNLVYIRDLQVVNINIPEEFSKYSIEISIPREYFEKIKDGLEGILSIYGINKDDIEGIPAEIYKTSPPNIGIDNKPAIITENDGNENWLITNQNLRRKDNSLSVIVKINIPKILLLYSKLKLYYHNYHNNL